MPKITEQTVTDSTAFRWPTDRTALARFGALRVTQFCTKNNIPVPAISVVPDDKWFVASCAYYRPDTETTRKWMSKLDGQSPGINICVEQCGRPCSDGPGRNWSWPASVTDRTPYGVICHELGHHCDWLTGEKKGSYFSDYCEQVKKESKEPGLTNYANENPAEWFAEAFRLFVTNPHLLMLVRYKTYKILAERWSPVTANDWKDELGTNVPDKILRTLKNKGAN